MPNTRDSQFSFLEDTNSVLHQYYSMLHHAMKKEYDFLQQVAMGLQNPRVEMVQRNVEVIRNVVGIVPYANIGDLMKLLGMVYGKVITENNRQAARAYLLDSYLLNRSVKGVSEMDIRFESVAREATYRYGSIIKGLVNDRHYDSNAQSDIINTLAQSAALRIIYYAIERKIPLTSHSRLLDGLYVGYKVSQSIDLNKRTFSLKGKSNWSVDGLYARCAFMTPTETLSVNSQSASFLYHVSGEAGFNGMFPRTNYGIVKFKDNKKPKYGYVQLPDLQQVNRYNYGSYTPSRNDGYYIEAAKFEYIYISKDTIVAYLKAIHENGVDIVSLSQWLSTKFYQPGMLVKPVFRGFLDGAELENGLDFGAGIYDGVDFSYSKMSNVVIRHMRHCLLMGAELTRVEFQGNGIQHLDLSLATLHQCKLENLDAVVQLAFCQIHGGSSKNVRLHDVPYESASFSDGFVSDNSFFNYGGIDLDMSAAIKLINDSVGSLVEKINGMDDEYKERIRELRQQQLDDQDEMQRAMMNAHGETRKQLETAVAELKASQQQDIERMIGHFDRSQAVIRDSGYARAQIDGVINVDRDEVLRNMLDAMYFTRALMAIRQTLSNPRYQTMAWSDLPSEYTITTCGIRGRIGVDGVRGDDGAGPGRDGRPGTAGAEGQDGSDSKPISIAMVGLPGQYAFVVTAEHLRDPQYMPLLDPGVMINAFAHGGAGGNGGSGGRGGNGAKGLRGADATRSGSGSPGGNGGVGGDGGNGGRGGRGGHGNDINIYVREEDIDLVAALGVMTSHGGDGGDGGNGGDMGSGGAGGDRGSDFHYTTQSSHTNSDGTTSYTTHHHTNYGGKGGNDGGYGQRGRAGHAGPKGQDGRIEFNVIHPEIGRVIYQSPFLPRLTGLSPITSLTGIIEPGKKMSITYASIRNIGDMPTPASLKTLSYLFLGISENEYIVPDKKPFLLSESIRGGGEVQLQGIEIPYAVAEMPTPSSGKVIHFNAPLHLSMYVFRLLKKIHDFESNFSFPVLRVEYPIEMSVIRGSSVIVPGAEVPIAIKFRNISRVSVGMMGYESRLLKLSFRLSTIYGDVSGAYFLPSEGPQDRFSLVDPMVCNIRYIAPGSEICIMGTLSVPMNAVLPYESIKLTTTLQLADQYYPYAEDMMKVIQIEESVIQIADYFKASVEPGRRNLLAVVNNRTPRSFVEHWKSIADSLGMDLSLWNISIYNGIDFFNEKYNISELFSKSVIVFLNDSAIDDKALKLGITYYPHERLAMLDFFNLARYHDVATYFLDGSKIFDANRILQIMKPVGLELDSYDNRKSFINKVGLASYGRKEISRVHDSVQIKKRSFIFSPSDAALDNKAEELKAKMLAQRPDKNYFIIKRYNISSLDDNFFIRKFACGTIEVRTGLDTTHAVFGRRVVNSSAQAINPATDTYAIAKLLPFSEKLALFCQSTISSHMVMNAIMSDLADEHFVYKEYAKNTKSIFKGVKGEIAMMMASLSAFTSFDYSALDVHVKNDLWNIYLHIRLLMRLYHNELRKRVSEYAYALVNVTTYKTLVKIMLMDFVEREFPLKTKDIINDELAALHTSLLPNYCSSYVVFCNYLSSQDVCRGETQFNHAIPSERIQIIHENGSTCNECDEFDVDPFEYPDQDVRLSKIGVFSQLCYYHKDIPQLYPAPDAEAIADVPRENMLSLYGKIQ